jgi:hypothetical protein
VSSLYVVWKHRIFRISLVLLSASNLLENKIKPLLVMDVRKYWPAVFLVCNLWVMAQRWLRWDLSFLAPLSNGCQIGSRFSAFPLFLQARIDFRPWDRSGFSTTGTEMPSNLLWFPRLIDNGRYFLRSIRSCSSCLQTCSSYFVSDQCPLCSFYNIAKQKWFLVHLHHYLLIERASFSWNVHLIFTDIAGQHDRKDVCQPTE